MTSKFVKIVPLIHRQGNSSPFAAIDSLGLRRNGSSSQVINQARNFPEQFPRHRHPSQLERDVPAMANDLGADLDQVLPQRGQRPVFLASGRRYAAQVSA
jgi:hypothetical protein